MASFLVRPLYVPALLLLITSLQNVQAVELVLQPDGAAGKDAQLQQASPDENIPTGYLVSNSANNDSGLIEFDVSAIPDGATVTSASLELLEETNCSLNINSIEAHLNTAAWSEATVTWNNAPAFGASIATNTGEVAGDVCHWLLFDVTPEVQDWVDGSVQNYGFRITGPAGAETTKYILSSDDATAANRPILRINYDAPVVGPRPPPTPVPTLSIYGLMLTTLGLLLAAIRRRQFLAKRD